MRHVIVGFILSTAFLVGMAAISVYQCATEWTAVAQKIGAQFQ
jgi:hypothetical protein